MSTLMAVVSLPISKLHYFRVWTLNVYKSKVKFLRVEVIKRLSVRIHCNKINLDSKNLDNKKVESYYHLAGLFKCFLIERNIENEKFYKAFHNRFFFVLINYYYYFFFGNVLLILSMYVLLYLNTVVKLYETFINLFIKTEAHRRHHDTHPST